MYKFELCDKRVILTERPEECVVNQRVAEGWEFIQAIPWSAPNFLIVFKLPEKDKPVEKVAPAVKATVTLPKEEINSLTGK